MLVAVSPKVGRVNNPDKRGTAISRIRPEPLTRGDAWA